MAGCVMAAQRVPLSDSTYFVRCARARLGLENTVEGQRSRTCRMHRG